MENRIDKLFRSKLGAPAGDLPGDADMARMQAMLSGRKKKNRNVLLWFLLPLLAIGGATAFLFLNENSEIASTKTEVQQHEPKQEMVTGDATNSNDQTPNELEIKIADDETAEQLNEVAKQNPVSNSGALASSGSNSNRNFKSKPEGNNTKPKSQKTGNTNSNPNGIPEKPLGILAGVVSVSNQIPEDEDEENSQPNSPVHLNGQTNPDSPDDDASLNSATGMGAPDSTTQQASTFPTIQITTAAEPLASLDSTPVVRPWLSGIEFGLSFAQANSQFGIGNDVSASYISRRDNEELKRYSFGADVLLSKDFNRWRLQSGWSYFCFGEDVQYSPTEFLQPEITDNSYWNYMDSSYYDDGYSYSFVNFLNDEIWVYDSTLVEIIDSTYIEEIDTSMTIVIDESITLQNGLACVKTFSVPLYLGYSFFNEESKWNVMLKGGVEFSHAFSRKAHYINRAQNGLISSADDASYRNFAISGYAGLNVNRKFGESYYLFVESAIRSNFSSWNKDFSHRYNAYLLRAGVGLKF